MISQEGSRDRSCRRQRKGRCAGLGSLKSCSFRGGGDKKISPIAQID